MALERQSIERKDFPIGPRGYDPEAVDAHLARLADAVEQLKLSSRERTETIASAASEQVRAIVEAAETSAAELHRQAEQEAHEVRAAAAEEAQTTRQQASTQIRAYVGKVSESTTGMLQRLDAVESELAGLIESLRTGASRISADLQLLESGMQELRGATEPRPASEPAARPGTGPGAGSEAELEAGSEIGLEAGDANASAPQPSSQAEPALDQTVVEAGVAGSGAAGALGATEDAIAIEETLATETPDETEGARLIALNMALNGTPREETLRYLAESFSLADAEQLLDEVYASVES